MPDVLPGVEDAVALGLTRDEYALVCEKLGSRAGQNNASRIQDTA